MISDFERACAGAARIGLDTSACIYFLGNVQPRAQLVRSVLARAQDGQLVAEISGIALMELLVAPYRSASKRDLERVKTFTSGGAGLSVAGMSERVLHVAAEIRASMPFATPDALVVASAAVGGCDIIVGNDRAFSRLNDASSLRFEHLGRSKLPTYVHLDDYVQQEST